MKKLTGTFIFTKWDPYLLILQIISMQSLLYVSLGFIMFFMDNLAETNHNLDHIFQYHEIHVSDLGGRLVIFAFVINSLVGASLLWCIVRRTKLCLDFSCTFHGIHLLICWWYNAEFPAASCWLLNCVCATLMCVCGEFLCLKTELREIPIHGYSSLNTKVDLLISVTSHFTNQL
uniref:Protein SYS1 homolog n=1 Tax=Corethrella appendiculata TaxID=1370023 RepID=U5EWV6_9DIPT